MLQAVTAEAAVVEIAVAGTVVVTATPLVQLQARRMPALLRCLEMEMPRPQMQAATDSEAMAETAAAMAAETIATPGIVAETEMETQALQQRQPMQPLMMEREPTMPQDPWPAPQAAVAVL
jgi:hypothetical protein